VTVGINHDVLGKVYPPSPVYEVGREKVREFAVAIDDPNPAYHDLARAQALGHPDLVAPPTFAFTVTLEAFRAVMQDPELAIDFSRVVHGEQRFTYVRPILAGDRLVVVASLETLRTVAGNDMVTTRFDIATPEGEPVATTWSMTIARAATEEAS
jgi:acyl dehydratase